MLAEFRAFILRGNVLDLAIAVVLGAAFNTVVSAFTDGVLMAAIAGLIGQPDFESVVVRLGDAEILIGTLLNAVVNLLLVGAALFLIVKLVRVLRERGEADPAPQAPPAPSDEAKLLAEIRDLLRAERA